MNIYGERVVLRAIEPEDNAMLLEMLNDPRTENVLGGASYPVSAAGQRKWFESLSGSDSVLRCIIADRENVGEGLGTVILSDIDRKNGTAEIHIKLAPESRGKGYGTDAVRAMVGYAFAEQRLNCVYAQVLSHNAASAQMFRKCGFVHEGVLRQRVYKNGGYADVLSFSVLCGEWKS